MNCNPRYDNGTFVPIWTFRAQEQVAFVSARGSRMIANEHPMPAERVPAGDIFTYAVVIRDPLDRWLSHVYYSNLRAPWRRNATLKPNWRIYLNWTGRGDVFYGYKDNYAVRMLTSKLDGVVGSADLEYAMRTLDNFTLVIPSELYSLSTLALRYLFGWNTMELCENDDRMKKGDVRGSDARKELPKWLLQALSERDKYDLALYDYAVRLFMKQIAAAASRFGGRIDGSLTKVWVNGLRCH